MTSPRSRPPTTGLLALTAAALAAFAADALADGAARIGHQEGYPRSSDQPPPSLETAPDGYGDEDEDRDGESYDTNLFFDGSPGDEDVVVQRVDAATIRGYGHVQDADRSSASNERGEAWGEDRLTITAPITSETSCTIQVTNTIRIAAAWDLAGNGSNQAVLRTEAMDIEGHVHPWSRTFRVDPSLTATTTSGASASASSGTSATLSTDGSGATGGQSVTAGAGGSSSETVASGSAINGNHAESVVVRKTFQNACCSVRISSSQLLDVTAQAIVDDVETQVRVAYFDTVNVVEATYTTDAQPATPGPGPATPGGEEGGSPSTGGGEEGGTPETPKEEPPPPPPGPRPGDDLNPDAPDDDADAPAQPPEGPGTLPEGGSGSEPPPPPPDGPGADVP